MKHTPRDYLATTKDAAKAYPRTIAYIAVMAAFVVGLVVWLGITSGWLVALLVMGGSVAGSVGVNRLQSWAIRRDEADQ